MIVAATEVSHDLTDEQMGYLPETLASFSDSIRYLYPYLKEINDLSNELNQNRQELTLRLKEKRNVLTKILEKQPLRHKEFELLIKPVDLIKTYKACRFTYEYQ
jgi:hypothetical protein